MNPHQKYLDQLDSKRVLFTPVLNDITSLITPRLGAQNPISLIEGRNQGRFYVKVPSRKFLNPTRSNVKPHGIATADRVSSDETNNNSCRLLFGPPFA